MSQFCRMLKNPVIYVEVGITGQIDRPFLARNFVLTWWRSLMERLWIWRVELKAEHKGPAAIGLGATGWQPRDRDPNLHLHLPVVSRWFCVFWVKKLYFIYFYVSVFIVQYLQNRVYRKLYLRFRYILFEWFYNLLDLFVYFEKIVVRILWILRILCTNKLWINDLFIFTFMKMHTQINHDGVTRKS
jgi:hypothetical protein